MFLIPTLAIRIDTQNPRIDYPGHDSTLNLHQNFVCQAYFRYCFRVNQPDENILMNSKMKPQDYLKINFY